MQTVKILLHFFSLYSWMCFFILFLHFFSKFLFHVNFRNSHALFFVKYEVHFVMTSISACVVVIGVNY